MGLDDKIMNLQTLNRLLKNSDIPSNKIHDIEWIKKNIENFKDCQYYNKIKNILILIE